MSRPTSRVLALLELLQSGGIRSVAELAGRLGVDGRTVRRYVEQLLELEIPVESVRGRYGGYRLAPGYRLPPLMLDDEEALAVLLGLSAARRAGLVTASATAAETAAAKIRRVLPRRLAARLDALLTEVAVTGPGREVAAPDGDVLLAVADAVHYRRPLSMRYRSGDGRLSDRTVHPYGLVAHSGRWYLDGLDVGRGRQRTFRLDRISRTVPLRGAFRPPDGYQAADRVLSGLAAAPRLYPVCVLVEATPEQVRRRLPAGVATLTGPDGEGRLRVEVQAEELGWVAAALAALDRPFVIESPDELRLAVRELAARLAASAGRGSA